MIAYSKLFIQLLGVTRHNLFFPCMDLLPIVADVKSAYAYCTGRLFH